MSFLQKHVVRFSVRIPIYKAAHLAAFLLFCQCGDSVAESPVSAEDPFSSDPASGLQAAPVGEPGAGSVAGESEPAVSYRWPGLDYRAEHTIVRRIPPPADARRVSLESGSFGFWLRNLPLKPGRPPVRLFNGALKTNQSAHHAVVDIDAGKRDLQQCADALMRLRSEYLFATGELERIRFQFTDQSEARYTLWRQGYRPVIRDRRKTRWIQRAKRDDSYAGFRSYLVSLFTYAGTYSLSVESQKTSLSRMDIGDFFIQGGFPGHGVMVVDMAESTTTPGRRYYLLAQSYMPAQDIHILRNPQRESPWYVLDVPREIRGLEPAAAAKRRNSAAKLARMKITTPEWDFTGADLMRFRN